MKKFKLAVAAASLFCIILSGCAAKHAEPDISQIRSICNLATLECYYHNVAKSDKEADSWLKKDREFWIEYTGIAKIGIDMSKVNMEISKNTVTVTLPNAELLDIDICEDNTNKISYIVSPDGLIKNKITADEQTAAINSAQTEMSESVKNNKTLLFNAQERAKELIGNYIAKMGEISGREYQINWVYKNSVDENAE